MFNLKRYVSAGILAANLTLNIEAVFAEQFHSSQGTISYEDVGKGPVLILINPFPTDKRIWQPQQGVLSKYFRVITMDEWGFGNSEATAGQAVTMSAYADEVNQLLGHLHIKKAIIGGESMGGYIALAFLQKYPNKVNGLILSDTQSIADTSEQKATREVQATEALNDGTTKLIDDFTPLALSPAASEQQKSFIHNIFSAQAPTAFASGQRGMALRQDTSSILAKTKLPVLIITGDQDALIPPQQSHHMHILAKHSKLITIPNAGHLSSVEQAEQWNQAVINKFSKPK